MTMKLKVQHLMDATVVISTIIRENRPLPQKGAYRMARLHDKLKREFEIVNERRNQMIKAYDHHAMMPNPAYVEGAPELIDDRTGTPIVVAQFIIDPNNYNVPLDKLEEFNAAWLEIGETEIEVDINPVPLEQLCFADPDVQASISAQELIALGDIVQE